jgi:hypothetical protein
VGVVLCEWVVSMHVATDPCLYAECGVAMGKFVSRKGIDVLQLSLK